MHGWRIMITMKRTLLVVGVLAASLTACSKIKTSDVKGVIVKDVPLEDQLSLREKYIGRIAWARMSLEDLTEKEPVPGEARKRTVPLDGKITIVDLNFAFKGSVTMEDHKHRKIVIGLNVERPLAAKKMEARLTDIMWFKDPMLRHVEYIRRWGTKTARAVVSHEVFVGMPAEAALEAWGLPATVDTSQVGDIKGERWVYKQTLKNKHIYISEGKVTKWED
jgi:hypothetical protein